MGRHGYAWVGVALGWPAELATPNISCPWSAEQRGGTTALSWTGLSRHLQAAQVLCFGWSTDRIPDPPARGEGRLRSNAVAKWKAMERENVTRCDRNHHFNEQI